MKTAMQEMIEEIDNQQKRYIDLAKKDKKLSKGVDAILTATTLLKMKAKGFLEAEKEQIMKAWESGYSNGVRSVSRGEPKIKSSEEYYNSTFKSNE